MSETSDEDGRPGEGQPEMTEEEYRQAMEEELKKASVTDIVVQSTVTILNLTSRRIAIEAERDLAQAKLGIDVVSSVAEHLPAEIKTQVDQALSQLRLEFAKHVESGAASGGSAGGEAPRSEPAASEPQPGSESRRGSGLWTPPGT